MSRSSAEMALPGLRAARRAFDRAHGFADASVVHDETRRRLLERLTFTKLAPEVAVDLGCALGSAAADLAQRYPAARVLAVDSSAGMLRRAAARAAPTPAPPAADTTAARTGGAAITVVGGDAHLLPLRAGSVQLLFANLVLPWCLPPMVFSEAARVLAPGGLFTFATLGPDSLQEVRRAWAGVDDKIHVHALFDMHDLGDIALAAGLAEPVLDVDRIEVSYLDVRSLVRDLRSCGAVNVAPGRRKSLTGLRRWQAFEQRLLRNGPAQRFTITLELVLGQAWGRGPSEALDSSGPSEVGVPIERIGRRSGVKHSAE